MTLFRSEALNARSERLHGDVNLAVPTSWHSLGVLILVVTLAAGVFLVTARYARSETVTGGIVADRGVAPVVSTRPGVVASILVADGDEVRAGQPVARLSFPDTLESGSGAGASVLQSLAEQEAGIAAQLGHVRAAAVADAAGLRASLAGIEQEIDAVDDQIDMQRQLVSAAEADVTAARTIAEKGFLKRHDLRALEDSWLGRKLQLSQLEASRAAKVAAKRQISQSISEGTAQAEVQTASLASARAELQQRRVGAEAASAALITAPVDGKVTALTARVGQPVGQQAPLMSIVPTSSTLRAELYVPTTAIGFMAEGQEVRVAVDAFPYERFGIIPARIERLSSSTILRSGPQGTVQPVYLATASLSRTDVPAFGRRQALLPGMTIQARVITERQSLARWLLAPLEAVKNR